MLEWLGEEIKQAKESVAEQLCMDNVATDLNEFENSSVSDSTEAYL